MGSKRGIMSIVPKRWRRLDKRAMLGLALLLVSFCMGALLRNTAQFVNGHRFYEAACDDYITGVCIPTAYIQFPIPFLPGTILDLNVTSFAASASLFVIGVILVRE